MSPPSQSPVQAISSGDVEAEDLNRPPRIGKSHAHINRRLPPEMLCEIFLHLVQDYEHHYSEDYRDHVTRGGTRFSWEKIPPSAYTWTRVTHVCRYWREAALNFPRLWTRIVAKDPECLETFLQRSKQASLIIRPHRGDTSHVDRVTSAVVAHGHRIRVLELNIPFPFWDALSDNAPLLEELQLYRKCPDPIYPEQPQQFTLPRLRMVELNKPPFPLLRSIIQCTSITRLSLRYQPTSFESLDNFIGVIGTISTLHELELHCVFSENTPDPTHSSVSCRATLPHLRYLCIVEDKGTADAARFLQHITIPPSTKISFTKESAGWNLWSSVSAQFRPVVEALAAKVSDDALGPTQDIISLRLCTRCRHSSEYVVEVEALLMETDIWELAVGEASEAHLLLTVRWLVTNKYDTFIIMRSFVDTFPLSSVQFLAIDGCQPYSVLHTRHLETFKNVRELFVADITVIAELYDAPIAASIVPFPKLHFLGLWIVRWRRHPVDHPKTDNDSILFDDVRSLLQRRISEGVPIKKLFISLSLNMHPDVEEAVALAADGLVEEVDSSSWEDYEDCSTCYSSDDDIYDPDSAEDYNLEEDDEDNEDDEDDEEEDEVDGLEEANGVDGEGP